MKPIIAILLPLAEIITYAPGDNGPFTENAWVCRFENAQSCVGKDCSVVMDRGPVILSHREMTISRCNSDERQCRLYRARISSKYEQTTFDAYEFSGDHYLYLLQKNLDFTELMRSGNREVFGNGKCEEMLAPPSIYVPIK